MDDFIVFDKVEYYYTDADQEEEGEKFDRKPAISDVSFSVKKGEFVCILGRNGSGKSTCARLMNALLVPTSGKVTVAGMDTADEKETYRIRQKVGMVFQNPDTQIIASSVEEDVAFGLENLGIPREEMEERISYALKACGIEALRYSEPHNHSGGQKQKIAICGILAMKPECIVFDESTAMLDPKGRKDILKIARKLNREENITVVLITHHMDEAEQADKVLVMKNSRLLKIGTPAEIFADEATVKEAGLELPVPARLFKEMTHRGLEFPDILTSEDAAAFLDSRLE